LIDGASTWLEGLSVRVAPRAHQPVTAAAELLSQFGAAVDGRRTGNPGELALTNRAGTRTTVRLCGWTGRERPYPAALAGVMHTYAALRLAGAAATTVREGSGAVLSASQLSGELTAPVRLGGGTQPQLVRCRDGWVVARWRDESEPELLRAMVGPLGERTRADVVAAGRLARLLVAPVLAPSPARAAPCLGIGTTAGGGPPGRRRPRVLDWTVLWAGPWATGELQRSGAVVHRIEHPRRRDGLLGWPEGRRCWQRLNAHKRVSLFDARGRHDRPALEAAIAGSDLLVTSMTPRALGSLGFCDAWRRENAPHLLHLELVAFEAPWADAPGLGEHAAAQAGLLWRANGPPGHPAPWADPLLGACALAVAQAWLASRSRPGGRVRLSLEGAARLAAVPVREPQRRAADSRTSRHSTSALSAAGNPA
jgi:hypothetical protein